MALPLVSIELIILEFCDGLSKTIHKLSIKSCLASVESFHDILNKISTIKVLTLREVPYPPSGDDAALSGLNQLDLVSCQRSIDWIRKYGDKVRELAILLDHKNRGRDEVDLTERNLERIDFSKLNVLHAYLLPNAALQGILKSAKNLIKAEVTPLKPDEIEEAVSSMIIKQQKLQFLVSTALLDHVDKMIGALEYGLFKTKDRRRRKFTFKTHTDKEMDIDKYMIYIDRITNALSTPNIETFTVWASNNTIRPMNKERLKMAVNQYVQSNPNIKLLWVNGAGFEIAKK